eukprot:scaffold485_cov272-Pinguiococcus_pyrenoidosus.AAC.13
MRSRSDSTLAIVIRTAYFGASGTQSRSAARIHVKACRRRQPKPREVAFRDCWWQRVTMRRTCSK